MRNAARTDANQPTIIKALRAIGCQVIYIKWPTDLVVSGGRLGDQTLWMEVKMPGEKLTVAQELFWQSWPGRKVIVTTEQEAIEAVLGRELLK
jgi:hypothetical protein